MDRFSRLNNQSPIQSKQENENVKWPRSKFDFSCLHSGQALFGACIPIDIMETVPHEDYEIGYNALIELRNPTVRKLLSGCRVYFHTYYSRCSDLWEGWNNYIDNGRGGNIALTRPNLVYESSYYNTLAGTYKKVTAATPMSLMDYLGLPSQYVHNFSPSPHITPLRSFEAVNTGLEAFDGEKVRNKPDFIDALPFMMYQRVWRDMYANSNLLQNNKFWFPDNEDHFILSYSCNEAVCIRYEDENFENFPGFVTDDQKMLASASNIFGFVADMQGTTDPLVNITPECNNPSTYGDLVSFVNYPNLSALKFRQFKGDRFTTSLPFPDLIRGDIPSIGDFTSGSDVKGIAVRAGTDNEDLPMNFRYAEVNRDGVSPDESDVYITADVPGYDSSARDIKLKSSITLNDIRALEVFTVFKERMARTDGSYNRMIQAQFGFNPNVHDRTPIYIGGYYQDFAFNSVVQTSADDENSPLGRKAGQGVSSGSGYIGKFHTPDYGYIMTIMTIVPDVNYTDGIPRMFSRKHQIDNYFPIFNNLSPQPILNKEIFVSGNASTDNSPLGWEERFSELKSRPNRVSGFSALSPDKARFDTSVIMARRFNFTPALNSNFVTMVPENIDMNIFSVYDEPPFDFSVACQVSKVSPIPYVTVPDGLNIHG